MKKIKEISNDEMIAEFLLGEIDSSTFESGLSYSLAQTRYNIELIRKPDVNNHDENDARKIVLGGYRGYPNACLFEGLPECDKWHIAQFTNKEFNQIKAVNCEDWITNTNKTRDFNVLAEKIRKNEIDNPKILKIAADYYSGKVIPLPIFMKDLSSGEFVVLEGNSRMTAHALLETDKFNAIVGEVNSLNGWRFE